MAWKPEDLQNPKWQRVRLEVMNRDSWTCQGCGATDRPLHVHHARYLEGRKPWEYCMSDLRSFCNNCHQDFHRVKSDYHSASLKRKHELWRELLSEAQNIDKFVEFDNLVLLSDPEDANSTLVLDVPNFLCATLRKKPEKVLFALKSDPETVKSLRDFIRKGPSRFCQGPLA